jgi:hypothetical protein
VLAAVLPRRENGTMSYQAIDERMHNGVYSVVVKTTCDLCKDQKVLTIPETSWLAWTGGELIQKAMPEISKDDRELLISGTCGPCFAKMFDGGDDE